MNELVLNVRSVVLQVDGWDVHSRSFDFGPFIDLQTHVLLHDVGMGVSDADSLTFLDNIEVPSLRETSEVHACLHQMW